jgi:hypothetical protein
MYGRDHQDISCILKGLEDQVIGIGLKSDAHLALVVEGTAKGANVKVESFPVLTLHAGLYKLLPRAFLFLLLSRANVGAHLPPPNHSRSASPQAASRRRSRCSGLVRRHRADLIATLQFYPPYLTACDNAI